MLMNNLTIVVVLCIFLSRELVADHHQQKTEKNLRHHLFPHHGYDKLVRPVKIPSHSVPVHASLSPLVLRSVDLDNRIIKLDTWLAVHWHDEYLHWEPDEFGGLESLNLPSTEVWRPDVAVYTGTPDSANLPYIETKVVIRSNGDVLWVPPFTIENRCPTLHKSAERFECDISLLSWTYDITQLDMNIRNTTSLEYFEDTHPEWHMESITPTKENKLFSCCTEFFPTIHFKAVFTKKQNETLV